MKIFRSLVLLGATVFPVPLMGQNLFCDSPVSEGIKFKITATVPSGFSNGEALEELTEVVIVAGKQKKNHIMLTRDEAYRPRTNVNRVRFNFEGINASDDGFDGIAHSIILPKVLKPADISGDSGDEISFNAKVASSTDSYHDGIISYFKLTCLLMLRDEN